VFITAGPIIVSSWASSECPTLVIQIINTKCRCSCKYKQYLGGCIPSEEQMPKQACARLLAGAALLLMAMEPAEFAGHVGGCGRLSNATRLFLADRCRLLLAHILPPQIAADLCASSPLPPPPSATARAT